MFYKSILTNERLDYLAKEFRKQNLIQTFEEYLNLNKVLIKMNKMNLDLFFKQGDK